MRFSTFIVKPTVKSAADLARALDLQTVGCPYTGEQLAAVPALEIMAHRIVWCCLLVFAWLAVRGELGSVRAALASLQHEKAIGASSRIEQYLRTVEQQLRFAALPQFDAADADLRRIEFLKLLREYRKRRRAFDNLFKHCRYDRAGSFAYRWECVLHRLDQTDVDKVIAAIRQQIWVLNPDKH